MTVRLRGSFSSALASSTLTSPYSVNPLWAIAGVAAVENIIMRAINNAGRCLAVFSELPTPGFVFITSIPQEALFYAHSQKKAPQQKAAALAWFILFPFRFPKTLLAK